MKKQQGIILELFALAVVAASFCGLWAYYHTQMSALTADNVAKAKTITAMGQEKATCMEANTGLSAANTHFAEQVGTQNRAVAALVAERDRRAAAAQQAKRDAATQSLVFKGRTAAILAKVAGVDWCKTWGTMVTDYSVMRRAK
jgi:peptidoglycan hydrolase CwlO-like protein